MRYTTIIDITEYPSVYRNHNARLVYMHMVLRSGYHNEDRDLLDISLRRLASATGLSVSATRHALSVLLSASLVKKEGPLWHVRKFIIEQEITPRVKTEKEARKKSREDAVKAERDNLERRLENERRERERLEESNTNSFIIYYESQAEAARNGDEEARQVTIRRRSMYLQHCQNLHRQPVEI